jgi:lipid II:glycine glycyltransferase (peptidoglycan interpeptide bridge formation enzyme)
MTPITTPITPTAQQWDAFVLAHPRGHALQLSAWGELKSAFGWTAQRLALTHRDNIIAGAQLLFKPLPLGLGKMAYLAFGGYVSTDDHWVALWQAIRTVCQQQRVAFLKWEAGFYLDTPSPDFGAWGFRPSPQTIQPPNTIYITLDNSDDAILVRMNQGTRRKIRQSLKNDIRYYKATSLDDVTKFTTLMQTTGSRNAFGVHEPAYYDMAFRLFVPQHSALLLAEHEGDTLAGVFVFAVGDTAWYLYGASSNEKRNLMGSYGVQWQAIQWAKQRGCHYYDMWGIPDAPEATLESDFEKRDDGLWGVYGFKRGWGGVVKRSVGTYDLVYNRMIYALYDAYLRAKTP